MTNPTNNNPNNHDAEREGVENPSAGSERAARHVNRRRDVLDEELAYDVWLDECLAYVEAMQEDEDPHDG